MWWPVFALTAASTFAVHAVFGVHLSGRTALVLWPLFVLSLIGGLQADRVRRAPRRVLAAIVVVVGFALAVHCGRVANTYYTRDWRYDAAADDAIAALARAVPAEVGAEAGAVRLGAHWWYVPALRFHARRRGLTWLAPLRREERLFRDPFDYYYLGSIHTSQLTDTRTAVVAEFPVSDTVLLRRLP